MFIISVHDETGLELTQRRAYTQSEINFTMHELKTLYKGKEIRQTEYIPRTKEIAEKEIQEKLNKK